MRKAANLYVILLVFLSVFSCLSTGEVQIVSPTDESYVIDNSFEVSGVANGTSKVLIHNVSMMYGNGTSKNISFEDGRLVLGKVPTFADNFDDGDMSDWTKMETDNGDVSLVTENYNSEFYSLKAVSPNQPFLNNQAGALSPTIPSYVLQGTYWYNVTLYFYIPSGSHHWLEVFHDYNIHLIIDTNRAMKFRTGGSNYNVMTLSANTWYKVSILYVSPMVDTATVYVNDVEKGTYAGAADSSMTETNFRIGEPEVGGGNWGTAYWDTFEIFNMSPHRYSVGEYKSIPYDLGVEDPFINNISWEDESVGESSVDIFFRTAENITNLNETKWTKINQGYSSDAKRLIQYMANFTSDLSDTPSLGNISINYTGIKLVEISTDGDHWINATGERTWNMTLDNISDGDVIILARSTDINDVINMTSIHVTVDTTRPTGSIEINNGATYTNSTNVSLTLGAWDANGISLMMLSNDILFQGSEWQNYTSEKSWELENGDGEKSVYVIFSDTPGLSSKITSDSIVLDTIPPDGYIEINNGDDFTTTREVDVSLFVTDENGLDKISVNGNEHNYTNSISAMLDKGDGLKSLSVFVTDVAGNTIELKDDITLDTTQPAGMIDIIDNYTNTWNVEINLFYEDVYGVKSMIISNRDDFLNASWQDPKNKINWAIPNTEGKHTVYAKFMDNVGLISDVFSDSVVLDMTPPKVSVKINNGENYTNSKNVFLNITTNEKVEMMMISNSEDFKNSTWVKFENFIPWDLSDGEGEMFVYIAVQDKANNTGAANDSINVDYTPPSGEFVINGNASYTNRRDVILNLDMTHFVSYRVGEKHDLSDVKWKPYLEKSVPIRLSEKNGEKTVYGEFISISGIITHKQDTIVLDTTNPELRIISHEDYSIVDVKDADSINISGICRDNVKVNSLSWSLNNGTPSNLEIDDDGVWYIQLNIYPGDVFYIIVSAVDIVDHSNTTYITIKKQKDPLPPPPPPQNKPEYSTVVTAASFLIVLIVIGLIIFVIIKRARDEQNKEDNDEDQDDEKTKEEYYEVDLDELEDDEDEEEIPRATARKITSKRK